MPDSLITFQFRNTYGEFNEYVVADSRVYSYEQTLYLDGYCGWKKYTFRTTGIESDIFLLDQCRWVQRQDYINSHYVGDGLQYALPDEIPHGAGSGRSYWNDSIQYDGLPVHVDLRVECGGPPLDMHVERLTRYGEIEGVCRQCGWRVRLSLSLITRCMDAQSGEPVTDICGYLYNCYREAYLQTPAGQRELAYAALDDGIKRLSDVLPILYYVGKASGQLRKPKREMLRGVIRNAVSHEGIDDAMIDSGINHSIARLSDQEVREAIDRIAQNPQQISDVYAIAKSMVATGKTTTPAEEEILAYIGRRYWHLIGKMQQ